MLFNLPGRRFLFIFCLLLCLLPVMSAPLALSLGIILAQLMAHPYQRFQHQATTWLLKFSVIGLGFGMNVYHAVQAGKEGVLFTVVSIFGVLTLGVLLGRLFVTARKTSFLIAAGTAICGGSAIAALSPVMKAGEKEISVSLGIVFVLNAVALIVFPVIGHAFNMSQNQFGLWCALAIHDTSAVVGAASKYGEQALQVATTVKLARALWIVPVAFGTAFLFKSDRNQISIPYFIGLFILAIIANTYSPFIHSLAPYMVALAKKGLTITLFLIGSGLSFKTLSAVGVRPFLHWLLLWLSISVASLWAIMTLVS